MSLFANRTATAQGIAARNHQRSLRPNAGARLNRFADALAEHDLETGDVGGSVRKASEAVGVSYAYGNALLQRMRKRLGWQAQ